MVILFNNSVIIIIITNYNQKFNESIIRFMYDGIWS